MPEAQRKAERAGLFLTGKEAEIVALALNNSKLSLYSDSQREKLPEIGQKLAGFLLDRKKNSKPKPPKNKRLLGFTLTREADTELQQQYTSLSSSLAAAAAASPIE